MIRMTTKVKKKRIKMKGKEKRGSPSQKMLVPQSNAIGASRGEGNATTA